jgi:hypothetical protein
MPAPTDCIGDFHLSLHGDFQPEVICYSVCQNHASSRRWEERREQAAIVSDEHYEDGLQCWL